MNPLGIFLGARFIHLVQSKGRHLISYSQIDRRRLSGQPGAEEKVPEEVKLVALLKEEFRKNRIDSHEVALALSGKDIIVRTFEMPILPAEELKTAIVFEAKKHIPFKIEELVSDSQFRLDKKSRRYSVVFTAVRRQLLENYLSVFNQLNMKVVSLEYSAFSLLRIARLSGILHPAVVALISVGCFEGDEINFSVLENGFVLFSRDITFADTSQEEGGNSLDNSMILEKLKTELRISLDFYHRKFQNKLINELIFLAPQEYKDELNGFSREFGLNMQLIEPKRVLHKQMPFSLGFFKAYSVSLYKTIKMPQTLDLLAARSTSLTKSQPKGEDLRAFFSDITLDFRLLVLGVLLCLVVWGWGLKKVLPLQQQIAEIISLRPSVSSVHSEAELDEINSILGNSRKKLSTLEALVKNQLYLNEVFDTIPRIVPEGITLTTLKFQEGKLIVEGFAYQADSRRELDLINLFYSNFKNNIVINKYFKDVAVVSVDSKLREGVLVSYFIFSGQRGN